MRQIASSHSGQECMVHLLKVTFAAGVLLLAPLAVAAQGDTFSPYFSQISPLAPLASPPPRFRPEWEVPALRWDDHRRDDEWSLVVMQALRGHGSPLLSVVPDDIDTWCPAYRAAGDNQRAAFWAGMVSSLAWHESTHREAAVGGGGLWFGLVQIAPSTARLFRCNARSGQALLDGASNLRCGLRIMATTVSRDGVVSDGMRGMAADWGPFHSRTKREDMRDWVIAQDYCQIRDRPMQRPEERFEQAALVATE
jgi:hypothetical protein